MTVQPKKKDEMLAFARMCDEHGKHEDLEDGLQMKYIKMKKVRTLVLAAVILGEQFTAKSIVGCVLIGAGTLLMVL